MPEILIVEDEARIAAFLEKGLQKQGYQTTVATDGEQATRMIQQLNFDLILLDLGLPIKSGLTVLEELSQMPYPTPAVIVLTARADDRDRHQTFKFGARDYITKPFRFNDLLERVNAVLKSQLPIAVLLAFASLRS